MAASYLSLMLEQTLDVSIPLMERLQLLRDCSLQLFTMGAEAFSMFPCRDRCYAQIKDQLARQNIQILSWDVCSDADRQTILAYWKHTIFPMLRPTVHTSSLSMTGHSGLAARLSYQGQTFFGMVDLKSTMPDAFFFPDKPVRFLFLETLLLANISILFPGYTIEEAVSFHRRTHYLELSASLSATLNDALGLPNLPRMVLAAPANWDYVDELRCRLSPVQQERLTAPRPASEKKRLRNKMLLSHPQDSWELIFPALHDHSVQTVFLAWNRVNPAPRLVPMVQELSKQGVHVELLPWEYFGLCWICRKKFGTTSVQTFFTTGNWDQRTGSHWTLASDDPTLCRDAVRILQSKCSGLRHPITTDLLLFPSPGKRKLLSELETEVTLGTSGCVRWIVQDFCDAEVAAALTDAARAGVSVDLQIAGDTQFPELVPNLNVRAILGLFPIHGQVFSFGTGKRQRMYLSGPGKSLLCPVTDPLCRKQLQSSLDALQTSAHTWVLTQNGNWSPQ